MTRTALAPDMLDDIERGLAYLIELVRFLHNCAPAQSHGSDAALEAWLAEEGVS